MTDNEQKKIFSANLRMYVDRSQKQQNEIAKALGFNQKTFNGWCKGLSIPTMGKVQAIADYFGIGKSELLDLHTFGKQDTTAVKIPVLGRVAAGIPLDAVEEIIDYEESRKPWRQMVNISDSVSMAIRWNRRFQTVML